MFHLNKMLTWWLPGCKLVSSLECSLQCSAIFVLVGQFPVSQKPQIHGGAQWLSGRVLDSRPRGRGFEPHRRHCVVSLSKNINPSLVLVPPRQTRPFITERLLMGRKESNQTKTKQIHGRLFVCLIWFFTSTQHSFSYAGRVFLGWTSTKLG